MNWTDIEDAIHAWCAGSSGVEGFKAVWVSQKAPRPQVPFARLQLNSSVVAGSTNERRQGFDPDAELGQEVALEVVAQTDITVSVQVFAAAPTGNDSAVAIASRLRLALSLESTLDALARVGAALVEVGSVANLAEVLDTRWEPRAAFDVTFRVADGASSTTGYIATAEIAEAFDP